MKKLILSLSLILFLLSLFFFVFPTQIARRANRAFADARYQASGTAMAVHQKLLIADLHCDALLWKRNLLERSSTGHVDIPRLLEGNVGLQAFTIVTKMPFGANIDRTEESWDAITPLFIAQRAPLATWGSLLQRALYQARKLHEFAERSNGKLVVIKTTVDLERYLARREREPGITAGFLGLEGAHALEGDLANLDVLFDAGIRMIAPTHFFDTAFGGSAHGVEKNGLTGLGKEMIRRMEAKGIIVDLAHASPQTIDDALALVTKPVVVSHTGVRGTCDNNRNLSDDQITRIAQTGGVIGIGFWDTAVCGTDARAIAKAIRHTVKVAGVAHVALGSDFDGAVTTPFDAAGLVALTEALLNEGFNETEVALIMGGNVLRILQQGLPSQ
ncbi:MAG: dipeptidase [candidate division KSB1 bacterium]|nr:dipeptidase [candidate division KSB1 bacterium]